MKIFSLKIHNPSEVFRVASAADAVEDGCVLRLGKCGCADFDWSFSHNLDWFRTVQHLRIDEYCCGPIRVPADYAVQRFVVVCLHHAHLTSRVFAFTEAEGDKAAEANSHKRVRMINSH